MTAVSEIVTKLVEKSLCAAILFASLVACAPSEAPQSSGIPMRCLPYPVLAARLASAANETPAGTGVQPGGNLMQHFVSPAGSWTLVVIVAENGLGCVLAHGAGWQEAEKPGAL